MAGSTELPLRWVSGQRRTVTQMRAMVGKRILGLSIVTALVLVGRVPVIAVAALAAAACVVGGLEVRAVRRQQREAGVLAEHDLAA